jgi:hypothetical protein
VSDPYRRAGRTEGRPPEERPRGVVVRRAEAPEEIDEADRKRLHARQRAESIVAMAELEQMQRVGAIKTRALGALLVAIGALVSVTSVHEVAGGWEYSVRGMALAPLTIFAGIWYLAVGAGGASSIQSAPAWVKAGGAIAGLVGLVWGMTGYVDFVVWLLE